MRVHTHWPLMAQRRDREALNDHHYRKIQEEELTYKISDGGSKTKACFRNLENTQGRRSAIELEGGVVSR